MAAPPPGPRQRRQRASSAVSTLSDVAAAAGEKVSSSSSSSAELLLLLWDELPRWRRDNAFILSGYRPASGSYLGSLLSVFRVHNESVNIWTHAAGSLVLVPLAALCLYAEIAPRRAAAGPADELVFACFLSGAALCLGMSATYHALSNHSESVAKWGNKLDYSGIVCLIVGSYVPALYYGLFCEPALMSVYLYGIFLLGFGCGVVSWVERFRTPQWRPYRAAMFVGLGLSGVIPVCHGLAIYGYQSLNDRMGLNWVLFQGTLYIFGAFLYAVRWPERTSPGTFDIWGHSHQLFHILILLAAASHFKGMRKAFDYHHSTLGAQCPL
ncbi:putative mPR-like GPCR protein [Rosellinia necatrix]|uniref:Putative mPR-like GPCR protein n=1 Tax=Rosellinia necatrix TaxID=77044 RepID=A0A1W2TDE3_ROSNE|nr:putative mPR-like GPCR protein [Rosellinia necatrix]